MNDYSTCTVGIDLGDRSSVACIYTPGVVVGWFDWAHIGGLVPECGQRNLRLAI